MVVDDNLDAAETLSHLLELDEHLVELAHDGFTATTLAATFKPDVVFLDIGMPDMNGYETADALRKVSALEHITLVALTG